MMRKNKSILNELGNASKEDIDKLKTYITKAIELEKQYRMKRCIEQLGKAICLDTSAQPFFSWSRNVARRILGQPSPMSIFDIGFS